MALTIRPATLADAGSLQAIYLSNRRGTERDRLLERWQNIIKTSLINPHKHILVAADATQPAGYCIYREKEEANHISSLFIASDHHGEGIGKQLILEVAKSKAPITLEVFKSNKQALQFYEKQGFLVYQETEEKYLVHRPAPHD